MALLRDLGLIDMLFSVHIFHDISVKQGTYCTETLTSIWNKNQTSFIPIVDKTKIIQVMTASHNSNKNVK